MKPAYTINTSSLHSNDKMDPHAPLTPPAEKRQFSPTERKPSVTFDFSNLSDETAAENYGTENANMETPALLSPLSPLQPAVSVDINAQAVPDTILVALLDREKEMRDLVRHNHQFFQSLETHLQSMWPRFENTLYVPRLQMPDSDWIKRLSKALEGAPSLLGTFKELVGYLGEDEHAASMNDDECHATAYEEPAFANVDITHIRKYPQRLAKFPDAYPQFFINCEEAMKSTPLSPSRTQRHKSLHSSPPQHDEDAYTLFRQTLFTSRDTLPDDVWETKIYDQLDQWPNLIDQLKEIVAYEVEDEEDDEQ
ncbi:uncharacterized protein BYT42DRAFT_589991 [Radiomyces spectabilis]|uniref:uncharacterized protein n=1 Tax=Radiomyces spectabilis TaxID=64574 RepID=UPI00221EF4F7|nr:uncharacterized protein BYT42DRAFT_589991 [Radiomyces spectabilis]KAI8364669.1 hypothetical protein BYT42DRAFT_589991 [Radiomyces spectabilis]